MKTAYIEVGHRCYAKCISCGTRDFEFLKPSYDLIVRRVKNLQESGFERIRLTGLEPITHPRFSDIVNFLVDSNLKISLATTLLSSKESVISSVNNCDDIRISIHGAYHQYKIFHEVDAFDTLCKNLTKLNSYKFYYTLVSLNGKRNFTEESANLLVEFIKNFPKTLEIFQMHKTWSLEENHSISKFLKILDANIVEYKYTENVSKKMKSCTAHKDNLYVKFNGDVYPCCMAGGEVGTDSPSQVYLGNIDKTPASEMMKKSLINLKNSTCDKCTPKYYRNMEI